MPAENPAAVRAFVAASIRGWDDFDDRRRLARKEIDRRPQRADDRRLHGIQHSRHGREQTESPAIPPKESRPVSSPKSGCKSRWVLLVELKIIPAPIPLGKVVSFDFLPPAVRAKVE